MRSIFQQPPSRDRADLANPQHTSPRAASVHISRHFTFSGYSFAIVSVFFAFLLRLLADQWLGDSSPYLTFVVAIAATGLYAGVRSAAFAALLGAITAYFCFVPPRYELGFAGINDAVGFGVYLVAAIGTVLLTVARKQATARAEESFKQQIEIGRRLLDAQSLLKTFLDNGPACAYLKDEDGRYVYFNEMAKRLLGIEGPDASSINAGSTPTQSELHFGAHDREILETGLPKQFVDKVVRENGEHYWLTIKFPFIDQNGKQFIGGTSFEITERVQAEEVLRKTERIASSGQMASLLSHHINNPLAAVTNCLYLLAGETLMPTAARYLSLATKELDRLNRITGLTLSFYHENENPAPVSICPVIEEVAQALSAVPTFQHIRINQDFRCDPTVLGLRREIQQLMTSLLANAMESGATRIRIRVSQGHNWRRPGVSGTRVSIADNGYGIDRENVKQLFQPFFSTKGTRGTGLGLWSSRVIVRKIEGSMKLRSVSSGPRTGTSVSLFLPTIAMVADSVRFAPERTKAPLVFKSSRR